MARTTQETPLHSATARLRLGVRVEPYYRALQRGLALGYRRGQRGGTWLARTRDTVRNGYVETKIGPADDQPDKTVRGLSYDEAAQRAREIFAEQEAKRTSGVRPGSKKKTVNDVLDHYVDGYKSGEARRDEQPGRDLKNLNSILKVHVRPALGHIRLDQLNSGTLEKFKSSLVQSPKLSRSGRPAKLRQIDDSAPSTLSKPGNKSLDDENQEYEGERLRKRRARANRVLTPLRAALNYSVVKKVLATDTPWRTALRPYSNVDGATVRYLTLDECERLQSCSDDDLRSLVTAALFTGGRYGSLRLLRVSDLDFASRTAVFRVTKSGKRQTVKLTEAACKFLREQVKTKLPNDLVFLKSTGTPWKPSDQARPMRMACKHAQIKPAITFHTLRDTFASHLVMAGVPILTVSQLLGHADVRVTQRHYAHLSPDHLQQAVDLHLPDFSGPLLLKLPNITG